MTSNNRTATRWLIAMAISCISIYASEPTPLQIVNQGFEDNVPPNTQRDTRVEGWTRRPAGDNGAGTISHDSPHTNRAKQGTRWAYLSTGHAIGQLIGDDPALARGGVDRLFVGATVSSIQDEQPNQLDLSVSLYSSDSRATWVGGTLISSKRIEDLTNDNRGDPNSYIDAYAILRLEGAGSRKPDANYWLVFQNNHQGAVTLDDVKVYAASAPRQGGELPNILIVFQDDMGYGDASFMNPQSKIRTPNLDRLASEGMAFMNAHSAGTICGPSRAGLLTGTAPHKLGIHDNFVEGGKERLGPSTLPTGTPTLATICRAAGYDTAVVGKWGIPSNWDHRVRDGVTEELSEENAERILDFTKPIESANIFGFRYTYLYDEHRPFFRGETGAYEGTRQPWGWHENGFAVRGILAHSAEELFESYLRAITDRAVRYIQTKAGLRPASENDFRIQGGTESPFYIHYLTHAPHLPIVPAAQFRGMSEAGPYGDFVVNIDYSLGRLMKALENCGLARNTIVIFSSDNGPEHHAYERARTLKHFSMGKLRGVKRDLYEGGHRVPLVVRWPAVIQAGRVSNALVSLTDWYATVAAITGQSPDASTGLDSMSILPILKGTGKEVRGLMLQDTAVGPNTRGIRVGPWMYIDGETGEMNRNREPEWFKQLHDVQDAPGNELYNLASDPGQGHNRIVTDAQKAAELKALFEEKWAPGARSTPPFDEQQDSDGDGYSDSYEQILGYDKTDAASPAR